MVRLAGTLAASLCALVAVPATASALQATSYADDDSASNTPPCVQATPCNQINTAIGDTSPNGTVIVDGGTYVQDALMESGKSLIGQEFTGAAEGSPVIGGVPGFSAVVVPVGETANVIRGLTLRSDGAALALAGPAASVTGNVFDSPNDVSTGISVNTTAAGASVIGPGNTFTDDGVDPERRFGVSVGAGSPTITANTFSRLSDPIFVSGASPTISFNEITGTHLATGLGGRAITITSGTPVLVANRIHSPDADVGAAAVAGIEINELGSAAGATMQRNRIIDHAVGLNVSNTSAAVTLDSDAIVNSNNNGIFAIDAPPTAAGEADITATNLTVNSGGAAYIEQAVLTLDSSLLTGPVFNAGGGSCSITFSRGPTTIPGGDGCSNFQTSADPQLAADGYHLNGFAMVDRGNPATPAAGSLDIDGGPRAVLNIGTCTPPFPNPAIRDIGADEASFGVSPGCAGPPGPPTPDTPVAPKKCKKGQKLRKGKCVKKKRKRKKK